MEERFAQVNHSPIYRSAPSPGHRIAPAHGWRGYIASRAAAGVKEAARRRTGPSPAVLSIGKSATLAFAKRA
jgi:hypothetical protein